MSKILVIDDHMTDDIDFNSLFSDTAFSVYISFDRTNGVDIAKRYLPNVIICNLECENDGFELIKELINSEHTQDIPIIYLSSVSSFTNQRRIMNEGADDYVVKPFNSEDLILSVERRIQKQTLTRDKVMELCRESFEGESQIPSRKDHILVTIGKRLQLIKYDQICCITALKEYSKVKTFDGRNIVIRKSLKTWLSLLPPRGFLRIHRSSIINVEAIQKIVKTRGRSYVVFLRSVEEPLELSQRYSRIMRNTFQT